LQAVSQYAAIRFAEMRRVSLSSRLMRRYLSQPYSFFLSQHSGDLAKNLLSEVDAVVGRCVMPLVLLLAHTIHAAVLVALVVTLEPVVALSATALVAGAFCIIFLFMRKRITRLGTLRMQANKQRYMVTSETFGGIKDVKLHSLEAGFIDYFRKSTIRFSGYNASNEAAAIFPRFSIQILVFGGMMLMVLTLLGKEGNIGNVLPTVGLLAFTGMRILPKFQIIYQSMAKIRFGTPALTALQGHLDMAEMEPPVTGDIAPLVPMRDIALENVTFHYPNTKAAAVTGLDLHIPVNATIGLVGASGAGKTTAIDLLLALYAPQEGRLRVDDTTIDAGNRRAWQRTLGYVPQDIFLLDASVRANIAFGIPVEEIDDAAIEHAARQANLHDFVIEKLPDGYETRVGERGIRLSGGQKQRIGIARALYRSPSVLVFDEATSAVDNVTEREIVAALKELGGHKTIVMIAHRLDTVRHCDSIYLMEHGRVVASGTFDELARNDARFQNMLGGGYA
jgi:ABC-type multidrug transport system fused ATPase/permease subunit